MDPNEKVYRSAKGFLKAISSLDHRVEIVKYGCRFDVNVSGDISVLLRSALNVYLSNEYLS